MGFSATFGKNPRRARHASIIKLRPLERKCSISWTSHGRSWSLPCRPLRQDGRRERVAKCPTMWREATQKQTANRQTTNRKQQKSKEIKPQEKEQDHHHEHKRHRFS